MVEIRKDNNGDFLLFLFLEIVYFVFVSIVVFKVGRIKFLISCYILKFGNLYWGRSFV